MPAIQLARLKTQVAQLADLYPQPVKFLRAFHDLLEFYSDRTYRPGQIGARIPLLPSYHVPAPVIRHVNNELAPLCRRDPPALLALADALWADTHLESRQLAAFILGQAPLDPPEAVTGRLLSWAQPQQDRQALEALLSDGARGARRELSSWWAETIKGWLGGDTNRQFIGIRGLQALVNDPAFTNLPVAYTLVGPLMQGFPASLQGALVEVIGALAKRSPSETIFFLRQVIAIAGTPEPQGSVLANAPASSHNNTQRIIRRCLPYFSEEQQAALKAVMAAQRSGSQPPDSGQPL